MREKKNTTEADTAFPPPRWGLDFSYGRAFFSQSSQYSQYSQFAGSGNTGNTECTGLRTREPKVCAEETGTISSRIWQPQRGGRKKKNEAKQ